jgi:hypothetical protein
MTDRPALALESLSDALWAERHALEGLLAHVVSLRLVLQAGEHRFVSACMNEVEAAAARLRERSAARAQSFRGVAPGPPTLARLVASTQPPLAWAFAEHQASFVGLVDDIDAATATARRLARATREQTLDTLSAARHGPTSGNGGPDTARGLAELGGMMELELRAQACRGVLLGLRDLLPGSLRDLVAETG